ncbi:MAG: hypothetical protein GY754_03330 [bacterium]|nr:hypothetical protein [bacterium]
MYSQGIYRTKKTGRLSKQFTEMIEKNHLEITEYFMNDLFKNNDTAAYRSADRYLVYQSSDMIFRDLSVWLNRGYPKKKIKERYIALGKDHYSRGIPFPQVQKAMVLQKRYLWLLVMEQLTDEKTDYIEAVELHNRVTLFFDRATYYMLKGYDESIFKYF